MIPSITCPDFIYEVVMSDGSPIDPNVFTFNAAAGTLTTETSDPTKAGNYKMKLTASYGATYPEKGSVDFMLRVINCEDLTVKSPKAPSVLSYTVGATETNVEWSDYTVTPAECTGTYTVESSVTLTTPNDSIDPS